MIRRLIVFGASGDVVSRYFLPAVLRLLEKGELPDGLSILGVARQPWTTDQFRRRVMERLGSMNDVDQAIIQALCSRVSYERADLTEPDEVVTALGRMAEPVLAYLAVPPSVFCPAVAALSRADLPRGSRLIVEKPFGEDLGSARELNRALHARFPESAVFRIDHFLGKQTVQNVLGLRFANRVFEPIWNHQHVKRVDIIWDETEGLEGRAGYYDGTGALKDMIQNHLLQLICLVGMEVPFALNERDFRDRKVDVLRSVRRLGPAEIAACTVRGRYGAGRVGDRELPAYRHEQGVDPERETETFAQVTLWIDNWRWAGVPFVLRTGKALARARREMAITFQPVPHTPFSDQVPAINSLRLSLTPDRVSMLVNLNGPGSPHDLVPAELQTTLAPESVPAYGHLLLDAMRGDPTFFIRGDEAEESWRIIDPIVNAWQAGRVDVVEYPAGSFGPRQATDEGRMEGQSAGRSSCHG